MPQHHTVSQGYLRAWTSGKRRTLYPFHVERGRWLGPSKTERVAKEGNFYSVEGEDPEIVEHFLRDIEGSAVPVIHSILKGTFPPEQYAFGELMRFVAASHVRTASVRRRVEVRADKAARLDGLNKFPNEEAFVEVRKLLIAAGRDPGTFTYAQFCEALETDEIQYNFDRGFLLASMIDAGHQLAHVICGRTWSIYRRASNAPLFVTSDGPVAMSISDDAPAPTPISIETDGRRFDPRNPDVVVTMPISPEVCLVGDFRSSNQVVEVGADTVATLNTGAILPGQRWVYAATRHVSWLNPVTGTIDNEATLAEVSKRYADDPAAVERDAHEIARRLKAFRERGDADN